MNRKFFYSLLTLTSLLAVYQLYLHTYGSKLKVAKLLSHTKDDDLPEKKPLRNHEALSDKHPGLQDIPDTTRTHDRGDGELFLDKDPQPTDAIIEAERPENIKAQLPSKLITVRAKGRLGNQMFEYASLLGIAYKNNLTAFVTGESNVVNSFNMRVPVYTYFGFSSSFFEYAEKNGCVFEPEVMHLGSTSDVLLKGYFQSWKYFDFMENSIREQFRWNKTITDESRRKFESLIPSEPRTYVGVHVRRGDMQFKVGYREFGYLAADLDYILRAMDYFRQKMKNVFFIVASDDYSWCIDNIKGDDVTFAEQNIREIDMAILTLCNHTVMTVGSFGWWAAWLTGGEVVYFKDFPRPGSQLDALFNADDYWLPSWIPM